MKALNAAILTERRDVFILDGVRFSLEMERAAYSRLLRAMRGIERGPADKPPGDAIALRALESAWSVCDSVHRVRGLVGQVRGLSHGEPTMQLFFRAAKGVEDARNFIQHIGSGIGKLGELTVPLVGQLRWKYASGLGGVSLSVGHWTKGTHGWTPVIDLQTMQIVDGIWFSVADSTFDLEALHKNCRALSRHLERWLRKSGLVGSTPTRPSTLRFGRHPSAGA